MAQSARAMEYTTNISEERWDSPNECAGYDSKLSDGVARVMLEPW